MREGLYSLNAYEMELKKAVGSALSFTASQCNGKAVARGTALMGFTDTHGLLGLSPMIHVTAGDVVTGVKPINLLSPNQLFVRCPQIKGDANLHNGRPSDILEVLPVTSARFRFMVTQRIQHSFFKQLAPRTLHELTLQIKDE
jgi:hypothetical protein